MKNKKTKPTRHTPHCLREYCCDKGYRRRTGRVNVDRVRPYVEPKEDQTVPAPK